MSRLFSWGITFNLQVDTHLGTCWGGREGGTWSRDKPLCVHVKDTCSRGIHKLMHTKRTLVFLYVVGGGGGGEGSLQEHCARSDIKNWGNFAAVLRRTNSNQLNFMRSKTFSQKRASHTRKTVSTTFPLVYANLKCPCTWKFSFELPVKVWDN